MKHYCKRLLSFFLSTLMLTAFITSSYAGSLAAEEEPLKKRATYYTDEKMANLAENIKKYDWVKSQATSYTTAADKYLEAYSLEEIWGLMPSQNVYRSYAVNQPCGCLNCGLEIDKFGNYPYTHDHMADPWKIVCPNCGMKFPTNDFGAYYKSGLDEDGIFQPSNADKSLLKNTLYPEKGENWGVDDGTGYVHTDGEKYFFIAYYAHWGLWYSRGIIVSAIKVFSLAYLYTGEQKYADAAIVMLCRLGDLYPSFNIKDCPWSEGYRHSGVDHGVIIGCIWETGLVEDFILAYDAVFRAFPTMSDDTLELLKAHNSDIRTYKDIMLNIENGFIKRIYREVKAGNIRGNNGMHQYSLALAAVVIDDKELTKKWLDYVFSPSGLKVSSTFIDDVDQDGCGNEGAPGYNYLWLGSYLSMANLLRGYKINGTEESYDLYDNIKFKKMFTAGIDIMATPDFSPNIGDTGSTGSSGSTTLVSHLLSAYLAYDDPLYARLIWFVTKGNLSGIRLTAFDKDPDDMAEKITADVKKYGEYKLSSKMLTGFGLAACMNFNPAANNEKFLYFTGDDFSVINAKIQSGVVREGGNVKFTPKNAGDSASFGICLNNSAAIYELKIISSGVSDGGKFDVFIDGRLLEKDVSFDSGSGASISIKNTFKAETGLHMITLRASEQQIGPAAIEGFEFIKQSDIASNVYRNPQTTMTMYFGRNTGHGHYDTLNLEIYAFGMNLTPDLGYPEYCDGTPNQIYWVENTVSHNTVLVNDSHMDAQIVSQPKAFDSNDFVSLVSVNADNVYRTTKKYRRTSALIKYDDEFSYVVDFFSVSGGKKHTYSFHPAETSNLETTGLSFIKQTDENGNFAGTLAGPEIEWGGKSLASGYQYLDKVQKDQNPDSAISFDWSIVDYRNQTDAEDMHLKLTMITDLDEVVLANGTPPRNKEGNPSGLDYVLASRKSDSKTLKSLFVSAIEPYISDEYIVSFEAVDVTAPEGKITDDSVKAIKVSLKNGRTDYIVYSEEPEGTYNIDNKFNFKGFFGIWSVRGDEVLTYTNDAVMEAEENVTSYSGKVVDFSKELCDKNFIKVKFDGESIDTAQLIGNYIYIANDGVRNACYRILGAEKDGDNYILDIGDITLIRQYKNAANANSGYIYNIQKNKKFTIPLRKLTGNTKTMLASSKSNVRDIVLSNDIYNNAKPGDKVANIYVVNDGIERLYQLPDYDIQLAKNTLDNDMFDVKNGWLYLKSDIVPSKTEYCISLQITDKASGISQSISKTLTLQDAEISASVNYPEFEMSEKKDTAEFISSSSNDKETETEIESEKSTGNENQNGTESKAKPSNKAAVIIAAVAAVSAVIGAVVIISAKMKKQKQNKN